MGYLEFKIAHYPGDDRLALLPQAIERKHAKPPQQALAKIELSIGQNRRRPLRRALIECISLLRLVHPIRHIRQ